MDHVWPEVAGHPATRDDGGPDRDHCDTDGRARRAREERQNLRQRLMGKGFSFAPSPCPCLSRDPFVHEE